MNENDDFCRICATLSNRIQNLFEIIHNGVVLAEMLKYCLKRPVNKADNLPRSICTNCVYNLITTYDFHRLCESSEQYFLKRFSSNRVYNESQGDAITKYSDSKLITPKIESESGFKNSSSNFDENHDFDKIERTMVSELVCVEENFDAKDIITEEDSESPLPISQFTSRNKSRTAQKRKRILKSDEKSYECYECRKNFDAFRDLRSHMHDHDDSRKPFECVTCKMRFVHLNSWFRHRSRHTKNIHDCEYCDQAFSTLTPLKHHIQDMHKDQLKAYKCDQCSEEFALHFLLVWHIEWHKKAKQFICSTCDAVFFNERKLKAHIRDNHASIYHLFRKKFDIPLTITLDNLYI